MNKTLSLVVAGLALTIGAGAYASPDISNKAMREVTAAKGDLAQGHMMMAIEATERAETTLLNAKQAGDETAPKALDAIKEARDDIMAKNHDGAMAALNNALDALKS